MAKTTVDTKQQIHEPQKPPTDRAATLPVLVRVTRADRLRVAMLLTTR